MVVYEDTNASSIDAATPVVSKVVNNILYFKAAKNHEPDVLPSGYYSLYYGSNYIKYIHATPVISDSLKSYELIRYPQNQIDEIESSPGYSIYYSATPPSINLYDTQIAKSSTGYYRLAYFNDGIDWINNLSKKVGSKITGTFSGPNLRIYGNIGPGYGKCRIRIITSDKKISNTMEKFESNTTENIELDWYEIDCYSTEEKNTIIFQKNDLKYFDYILEIEVIEDKNILSTSNQILINKISFLKNLNLSFGNQNLNPDLSFKSIGGIR